MIRLLSTAARLSLFAVLAGGCTGQTVEGAWQGPFPIEDAESCRMRLFADGRFDLTCRSRSAWLGVGRWSPTSEGIRIELKALAKQGTALSELPTALEFRVDGHGNQIDVERRSERFRWVRVYR